MGLTLPAPEFGIDPVQVLIAAEERVQRMGADVWDQGQYQNDTLVESHLVCFHQTGVFRRVAVQDGDRNIVNALILPFLFKKEAEPGFQHPAEPGQFPIQAGGIFFGFVHIEIETVGYRFRLKFNQVHPPTHGNNAKAILDGFLVVGRASIKRISSERTDTCLTSQTSCHDLVADIESYLRGF